MSAQSMKRYGTGGSYREKATRKFKENPFVPVGALATTAALVVAMVKMRRGESRSFNNWLRVRVLAQGLTICAIVVGTYSLGRRNADIEAGKTPVEADMEKRREEKMEKEKREFEGRLRLAEEAHRAEVSGTMGRGLVPRGAREILEEKSRAGVSPRSGSGGGGGSAVSAKRDGWWSGWWGSSGPPSGSDSSSRSSSPSEDSS